MKPPNQPGDHKRALRSNDRDREYIFHVPINWDGKSKLPLVFSFHGGGGTAKLSAIATRWSDKADEEGFFVVYPEGVRPYPDKKATFLRNPPFWNVGSGIGYADDVGIDDDAFMRVLFDDILERWPIDRHRIYASGFSNGASMALQLALVFPNLIAAVAPVSGHLRRFEPPLTRPISMLFIIGDSDPLNPLPGGDVTSPWGRVERRPPIQKTIDTWANWLGCLPEPAIIPEPDGLRRLRYGPGEKGGVVEFITIAHAGHVWPGGPEILSERIAGPSTDKLNATETIWDFFVARRSPRVDASTTQGGEDDVDRFVL